MQNPLTGLSATLTFFCEFLHCVLIVIINCLGGITIRGFIKIAFKLINLRMFLCICQFEISKKITDCRGVIPTEEHMALRKSEGFQKTSVSPTPLWTLSSSSKILLEGLRLHTPALLRLW